MSDTRSTKNVSRTAATSGKRARTGYQRAFIKALGSTIREIRRGQGLKQDDLGARVGIPGSRVGEIERGTVNTSGARICALAAALGLTAAALIRRAELNIDDQRLTDPVRARTVESFGRLDAADAELVGQIVARLSRVAK